MTTVLAVSCGDCACVMLCKPLVLSRWTTTYLKSLPLVDIFNFCRAQMIFGEIFVCAHIMPHKHISHVCHIINRHFTVFTTTAWKQYLWICWIASLRNNGLHWSVAVLKCIMTNLAVVYTCCISFLISKHMSRLCCLGAAKILGRAIL